MPVDVSDWEPVSTPVTAPTPAPSASDWEPVAAQSDWEPVDAPPTLKDDIAAGRVRIVQPSTEPDFTIGPNGERLVTPSGDFWSKLAGPGMPVSQPAVLPPEVAARVARVMPPLPAPQPAIGPLVQNIPQPSAQAKLMAKISPEAAGYAMQAGSKVAGQKLDLAGRVLAAAVADTSIELSKGPFSDDELSRNVKQVLAGETPDYELERKFLPKPLQAAESGAYGLVKTAPQLAGVAAAQAVGIPAPISSGVLFATSAWLLHCGQ